MTQINNLNMQSIYSNQRKSTDLIYRKDPKSPNLSLINCAILIINLSLGMEMFFYSEMYQYGYILILALYLISYALSYISFILLSKCWIYGQSFSFMTVWENAIGQNFSWIPDLLIFLCYFHFTVNYYDMAKTLIQEIVYYFDTDSENHLPSILVEPFFVIYIFIAIPSLLICFVKEIHSFLIISWIKILSLLVVITIHIYKFIKTLLEPDFLIQGNFHLTSHCSFQNLCFNFLFAIAICCHQPITEHVVQIMKKPTLGRTTRLYFYPTFLGCIIFLFFTTLTTLISGKVDFELFINCYDSKSKITICSKFFLLFYILTTIYLWQWMEARHFSQVFSGSWEISKWMNIFWIPNFLSCFIIIILNASGPFFPYIALIISDMLGKISASSLCLILGPVFYLRLYGSDKSNKVWIALSLILIIIGFFFIAYAVYGYITDVDQD